MTADTESMSRPTRTATAGDTQRKAVVAGALAYLISVTVVVYVNFGILDRFYRGDALRGLVDPGETARTIVANPTMFRLGIALDVTYCVGVVVVLAAFYVVLRPFGQTIALVAAVLQALFASAWALGVAQLFNTVHLLSNAGDLSVFTAGQLQALASLSPSIVLDHYYVGLLLWGTSATLFSYLWFKSRYVPKAFAALGMASGAWAAVCAFAFITYPKFADVVSTWWFDTPLGIFGIALSVLLLTKPIQARVTGRSVN